ncbi:(2Fe-2S) ferredoxin domain-containing protein [bacterium]|nr:(2Fe-2S) ferredoxin domain-containing protein [bacterium]MBP9808205.1 (2Fe-2S) ferredoxin domain-containing protein [bacterium]MDP3510916.1 (2Fe-2S) ferredoxin domain-containing protein [Candidatus Melainabacteria bacterium]
MASTCTKLLVCTKGKHCSARDSHDVLAVLRKTVERAQLEDIFKVKKSGCLGLCKHGPVVMVDPLGLSYGGVAEVDCIDIIERHVAKKKPIKRLLIKRGKHK